MVDWTDRMIEALEPGKKQIAKNLYIEVTKSGSRSWVHRYTFNGVRDERGIGGFPKITLQDAQEIIVEDRRLLRDGINPKEKKREQKRKANIPTFKKAAQETLANRRVVKKWTDETIYDFELRMKTKVFPIIGNMKVDEITRKDVLRILKPLWFETKNAGIKVRRYMGFVFKHCKSYGHLEENLVDERLDGVLLTKNEETKHYDALPFEQVADALEAMRTARRTDLATQLAFEFMVFTACRTKEVREMKWDDIGETPDAKTKVMIKTWTKPTTKNRKPHIVPLSTGALEVLEKAEVLNDGSDLVFPSFERPGQPLSKTAIRQSLKRRGYEGLCTPHGFRRSWRTWADECTDADYIVKRLCLSHSVGDVLDETYSEALYLQKRLRLLQQWADYLTGAEPGKVIEFPQAAAV